MTPSASPQSHADDAEAARLHALRQLGVLDSVEERAYDDLTRAAASLLGVPIALVSLIDAERQWFKSRVGLQARETPREVAFCAHAIHRPDQVMVVPDAHADDRFRDNPLVTGDPRIRFYAGAPLTLSCGHTVGTLCAIDTLPRDPLPQQLADLRFLADQVVALLEQRLAATGR